MFYRFFLFYSSYIFFFNNFIWRTNFSSFSLSSLLWQWQLQQTTCTFESPLKKRYEQTLNYKCCDNRKNGLLLLIDIALQLTHFNHCLHQQTRGYNSLHVCVSIMVLFQLFVGVFLPPHFYPTFFKTNRDLAYTMLINRQEVISLSIHFKNCVPFFIKI